jgi:GT2 family glycosyltransferase
MIFEAKISIPFEVVVLDNGSTDGLLTVETLQMDYPQVKVIANSQNEGFTKGVNMCTHEASGEYILNINTDVIVRTGDVEKMVKYLEQNPDIGCLGPQLLNFDGSVQNSYYRFLTPEIALYRRTFLGRLPFAKRKLDEFLLKKNFDVNKVQEVDWLLGASIMFRKDIHDKLGGLDEEMFLYLSDTDFCYRLWENGYRVVYFPKVKMFHYHRKSSAGNLGLNILFNKAFRIHIKDGVVYFMKHKKNYSPRLTYQKKHV